jgi:hypothetical protein
MKFAVAGETRNAWEVGAVNQESHLCIAFLQSAYGENCKDDERNASDKNFLHSS